MSDVTRPPAGKVESATVLGLFGALGLLITAILPDGTPPEAKPVVMISSSIIGNWLQSWVHDRAAR